jgi:hypothetical protein
MILRPRSFWPKGPRSHAQSGLDLRDGVSHQRRVGGSGGHGGLQRRLGGVVQRRTVDQRGDSFGVEVGRVQSRSGSIGGGSSSIARSSGCSISSVTGSHSRGIGGFGRGVSRGCGSITHGGSGIACGFGCGGSSVACGSGCVAGGFSCGFGGFTCRFAHSSGSITRSFGGRGGSSSSGLGGSRCFGFGCGGGGSGISGGFFSRSGGRSGSFLCRLVAELIVACSKQNDSDGGDDNFSVHDNLPCPVVPDGLAYDTEGAF